MTANEVTRSRAPLGYARDSTKLDEFSPGIHTWMFGRTEVVGLPLRETRSSKFKRAILHRK